MDVAAIPVAVSFSEHISEAIAKSRLLIVMIGKGWEDRIGEPDDPVRSEVEAAIENEITILPMLIGNTPMPDADKLPESIATIAARNAPAVGESLDFNAHMDALAPKIASILAGMDAQSVVARNPRIIDMACRSIVDFLRDQSAEPGCPVEFPAYLPLDPYWRVAAPSDFYRMESNTVSLLLHRIQRFDDEVELHVLFSFWFDDAYTQHSLAGWLVALFDQVPVLDIRDEVIRDEVYKVRIRRSDEDARQVWKIVTDEMLRLSLTYVATILTEDRVQATAE